MTEPKDVKDNLNNNYVHYCVNPVEQDLIFYWKGSDNKNYSNAKNLKSDLIKKNKKLIFAMNGGMFLKNQSPQGLYIENGVQKSKLDTTQKEYGNFYMQPNGVFYLSDSNEPVICKSTNLKQTNHIKYATQSGPMLIINGMMHSKFIAGSKNLHIRNGVGILPNGNILFAMSKSEVNFYDFAAFFLDNGCKNALYLDGYVSRTYLPSQNWAQEDGRFGVIIGVTKDIN